MRRELVSGQNINFSKKIMKISEVLIIIFGLLIIEVNNSWAGEERVKLGLNLEFINVEESRRYDTLSPPWIPPSKYTFKNEGYSLFLSGYLGLVTKDIILVGEVGTEVGAGITDGTLEGGADEILISVGRIYSFQRGRLYGGIGMGHYELSDISGTGPHIFIGLESLSKSKKVGFVTELKYRDVEFGNSETKVDLSGISGSVGVNFYLGR